MNKKYYVWRFNVHNNIIRTYFWTKRGALKFAKRLIECNIEAHVVNFRSMQEVKLK